jgi:hypothetical protein
MSLILNGDTGISAVDGTASAPALVGVDTDTGVYFSAANTLDFATAGTRRASINSTGDLQFNSGYGSVATAYGCRAWVNFNGTGTVAIRASGNVSSITDNGTGDYTVNFTNAMPDANYSVVGASKNQDNTTVAGGNNPVSIGPISFSTSSIRIMTPSVTTTLVDPFAVSIAVFR